LPFEPGRVIRPDDTKAGVKARVLELSHFGLLRIHPHYIEREIIRLHIFIIRMQYASIQLTLSQYASPVC
jgi:hypothetical protein